MLCAYRITPLRLRHTPYSAARATSCERFCNHRHCFYFNTFLLGLKRINTHKPSAFPQGRTTFVAVLRDEGSVKTCTDTNPVSANVEQDEEQKSPAYECGKMRRFRAIILNYAGIWRRYYGPDPLAQRFLSS